MFLRLLCFVALVAFTFASERPSVHQNNKHFHIQRQEDVHVTDMDRMVFDHVYESEQNHPDFLTEEVEWERLFEILEFSLGENWREKCDVDTSAGKLTQLEVLRLSARISNYNVEQGRKTRDTKTNICWCHGTSKYPVGSEEGWYYYGVRIMSPEGHTTSTTGAKGAPHDCLLCDGEFNCLACCYGVCTTQATLANGPSWGLYVCDVCDDDTCPNSLVGCLNPVSDCASAVALCKGCYERINVLKLVNCDCNDVVNLCPTCYDAWDAIDKYKHCNCKDYANYYQYDDDGGDDRRRALP